MPKKRKAGTEDYRDESFYMSHYQTGAAADRGYSLKDGQTFVEQARNVTMDLNGDEGIVTRAARPSQLSWDKKKRRFTKGDGIGADNKKLVRTESGAQLPASFKSGRFDEWKAQKRVRLPKVGEAEGDTADRLGYSSDKKYRHNKVTEAKALDPRSTTYERKVYDQKKKAEKEAAEAGAPAGRGGRGPSKGKSELRSAEDIRKQRKVLEQVSTCLAYEFFFSVSLVSLSAQLIAILLLRRHTASRQECSSSEEGRKRERKGTKIVELTGSYRPVHVYYYIDMDVYIFVGITGTMICMFSGDCLLCGFSGNHIH